MANTLSKLTTSGNYYTAGTLDEATFNPNTTIRTNILSWSTNLANNTVWSTYPAVTNGSLAATPTANTIAPDGTYTAYKLVAPNGVGPYYWNMIEPQTYWSTKGVNILNGQTAIISCYVKLAEPTFAQFGLQFYDSIGASQGATMNLISGLVTAAGNNGLTVNVPTVTNIGNGWYRFSVARTAQGIISAFYIYSYNGSVSSNFVGDGVSGAYVWGPQLEIVPSGTTKPSPYVPTSYFGLPSSNALSKLDTNGNYYTAGTIDEVTFNPIQTEYKKNIVHNSATPNVTTGATYPYYNWGGTFANTSVTLTTATTAPDGTYTAYKFVEGSSVNPQYVFWQQNFVGYYSQTYTFSMYVKAAEYNYVVFTMYDTQSFGFYFNLTTGAVSGNSAGITYGSTYVGKGWWRIWLTRTVQNLTKNGQIFFNFNPVGSQYYAGDGTSGGYFWGPQLEIGSTPSIYEPTGANAIPLTTTISKLDSNGNSYLSGSYDEYTRGFNIVQNGLIYYMDPSKPESWNGNTKIYDITGTYAPGSLVGGYTYSTGGGGSIRFDGSGTSGTGTGYANTNVAANNSYFQPLSSFTLSIWARFEKSTTTGANTISGVPVTGVLFGAENFSGFGLVWTTDTQGNLLTPSQTQKAFAGVSAFQETNTPTTSQNFTTGYNSMVLNQWYNFVMTQTATSINLYVNGSLSQTATVNTPGYYNLSIPCILIGSANIPGGAESFSQGQVQTFPGSIGQALIYNRTLSGTEISQNYNEMRSQYTI